VSAKARLAALLALACAPLSLATPAGAGAQGASLAFGACRPTQVIVHTAGLQCATLDVPFDWANPAAGSIALAVQRVAPRASRAGVIVLLAGGPGQPALPVFEALLASLEHEPALQGFELVAFDQRGTGQSEALQCPESGLLGLLRGGITSYFGACGTALGATRGLYTSQESVDDLDALREALGGTPLSLLAVSYGGRVAGMYASEHPQGVARMVLDSPSPRSGSDPLNSQRLRALRRVLDAGICSGGPCRSFSSDVYADLTRVVAELHHHPLRTRIYDARGRLRPASVSESGLLQLLSGLDTSQGPRELVPAAIAAAAHGDAAPLARLAGGLQAGPPGGEFPYPPAGSTLPGAVHPLGQLADRPFAAGVPVSEVAISEALFAATYCVENQMPWTPDSPPAGRATILRSWLASVPTRGITPFLPATVAAASVLPLCMDWPATAPAPPSPTGVSATPTLILSGDDDLRTPYEEDLTVKAGYSDAQLLRIPDTGHSTFTTDRSGCAKRAAIGFLAGGQAPAWCPGSSEPQALPLPSSSLGDVHPVPSRSPVAGRVAAAAAMTLEDLFGQTTPWGGGLRGGDWELGANGFALHGMLDVPGVALSGSVRVGADITGSLKISGHLTVRGRLPGTLALRGLTLSGRVGGARVRARLAAL
jgi:pimeloyl-ACP methyl ester carboxylesterase